MVTNDAKHIFIADDSLFFRTKLSDIFTEAGHVVQCAGGGRELIDKLKSDKHDTDLVVLDLQMPDVDGFGVLEWIKDNGLADRFPVLVITGVCEPGAVIDRLRRYGVSGLVTKAATPEQILFRVNNILYSDKQAQGVKRPRVPVSIPADFTIGDVTRSGYLISLSDSGAFLNSSVPILVGSRLTLKFSLPDSNRVFELRCGVQWSTDNPPEQLLFGGVGLRFELITPEEQAVLKRFVESETKRLA